jgi:hypothetical protein
MLLPLLTIFFVLSSGPGALAGAQSQPEPRIPLGAVWTLTLEQAQRLPDLERAADGTLKASYTIRSSSQIELVTRWQGRTVSLLFARDFGLYAIGVEMVPWASQHSPTAADPEVQDLEQCAPIRLAVMRKYGAPQGIAESWEATEVTPLPVTPTSPIARGETQSLHWPYARNWLVWEGKDTRLALGEQFVWYVSRAGLARREQARRALEKEGQASQERDAERRAQRQRHLGQAREEVLSRARGLESLF